MADSGECLCPPSFRGPCLTVPSLRESPAGDRVYQVLTTLSAACIPLLLVVLAVEVGVAAWPALWASGTSFITGAQWDAVRGIFGVAPAIYGTIVSSGIALLLATPLALAVAIFTSEVAPRWLRLTLEVVVDLLAAIPSVIYGLWGLFILVPWLRESVMPLLADGLHLGATPWFSGPAYGPSMLAAGVLLAIMILPYIASITREVLAAVPDTQREAALALGATRWEMIRHAVLPYARSGILGAIVLGLGRAFGETMAVTMVIGNRHQLSASLFAPGYTLASLIANEFAEASADRHLSALMAAGAVLLSITLVVNGIARWLVGRVRHAGPA
jgi:phosphate transport system permease protein